MINACPLTLGVISKDALLENKIFNEKIYRIPMKQFKLIEMKEG